MTRAEWIATARRLTSRLAYARHMTHSTGGRWSRELAAHLGVQLAGRPPRRRIEVLPIVEVAEGLPDEVVSAVGYVLAEPARLRIRLDHQASPLSSTMLETHEQLCTIADAVVRRLEGDPR